MAVRDFVLTDHAEVFSVARESWRLAYSHAYTEEFLERRLCEWYSFDNHKGMIEGIENGTLYFKVCTENEKITAFISGNPQEGVLQRLYIQPSATRKGMGLFLLRMFEGELQKRNIHLCKTSCDKKNTIGLSFYQKNGFHVTGEDDEDFLLEKNLWQTFGKS